MKTNILVVVAIIFMVNSSLFGQIKIHDDNHVSLGSLTKNWGLQMQPEGYLYHSPTYTASWAWYSLTYALNPYSKVHIVKYNNSDKFFVLGNGQIYSTGDYMFSDETLKENIEEIASPLEKIMSLSGISFDFVKEYPDTLIIIGPDGEEQIIIPPNPYEEDLTNNEYVSPEAAEAIMTERDRKHLGFIAQEVEQVLPELVRTAPDGKKALAYHELLAVCVEAIKELNKKTEMNIELSNKINLLNKQFHDLQIRLDKIDRKSSNIEKSTGFNNDHENLFNQAILYQNNPNPYSNQTRIKCNIPLTVSNAILTIYDLNGTQVKEYKISQKGDVFITINHAELKPGMYLYSLITDNILIDTKTMVLTTR